jgi:hypothetical protein
MQRAEIGSVIKGDQSAHRVDDSMMRITDVTQKRSQSEICPVYSVIGSFNILVVSFDLRPRNTGQMVFYWLSGINP